MQIRKTGSFKDELNGCVMSEMLGLNPKSYAFKYQPAEKNKHCINHVRDLHQFFHPRFCFVCCRALSPRWRFHECHKCALAYTQMRQCALNYESDCIV